MAINPVEQLHARSVGKLQIGQDHVSGAIDHGPPSLFERARGADFEFITQLTQEKCADRGFVVHDQDGTLVSAGGRWQVEFRTGSGIVAK
jgi:hypothetical protein